MIIKNDLTDLNSRIYQAMVVFQYYPSFITNALVMYNFMQVRLTKPRITLCKIT